MNDKPHTPKNPHAVALGRKGGLASKGKTSDAKKAAGRANLAKAREARKLKRLSLTERTIDQTGCVKP